MKALYRIDEVAEMLSMSRRSVYRLLDAGELDGHNDSPGTKGLKVTGESILRYVDKYKLTSNAHPKIPAYRPFPSRKIISKGIE